MRVIFFDTEFNIKRDLFLYGFLDNDQYVYFSKLDEVWSWLRGLGKVRIVAYNLGIDLGQILRSDLTGKITCNYNRAGLVSARSGNVFFRDFFFHYPLGIEELGKELGMRKKKIDYDFSRITDKLLSYNLEDLRILKVGYEYFRKVYQREGSYDILSTSASNAFDIYNRKFSGLDLYTDLGQEFRDLIYTGYYGGDVEVFKEGEYGGEFYKIDVNSLFPWIMMNSYPYPFEEYIQESDRNLSKFYLFEVEHRFSGEKRVYSNYDWDLYHRDNSGRDRPLRIKRYYNFTKRVYPFLNYVDHMNQKKENSEGLDRVIYKRLLNSLYGKFGQKGEKDLIIKADSIKDIQMSNVIYIEEYAARGFYHVVKKDKFPYWSNILWALYTTNRARVYMKRFRNYLNSLGFTIYYQDTDSLIISGDIKKISKYLDNKEIGKFKLEGVAKYINISGKKQYIFEDEVRCKGIKKESMLEYIKTGRAFTKRFVNIKESLKTNRKVGSVMNLVKVDNRKKTLDKIK